MRKRGASLLVAAERTSEKAGSRAGAFSVLSRTLSAPGGDEVSGHDGLAVSGEEVIDAATICGP